MMRKYINPKEVNEIYGIKPNTLARQRSGGYGIPFHRLTKPGTMKGIILYNVDDIEEALARAKTCLLYTSPSPRDGLLSRMPSSA